MENIKQLKKEDLIKITESKRILRGLCIGGRVDFQKDLFIFSYEGRFTINEVKKLLPSESDFKILFCRLKKSWRYDRENKQDFEVIDYKGGKLILNNQYFSEYGTDYFYRLGDFDEERKKDTNKWVAIAQKVKFILPPIDRHQAVYFGRVPVDYAERFKHIKEIKIEHKAVWTGSNYEYTAQQIRGFDIITKNKPVKTCQSVEYYSKDPEAPYIDKSGYLVAYYRDQLINRLKAYKSEKRKQEAQAVNLDNKIKELSGKIKEVKQILSDKIKQVKDFDTTKEVESKINTLSWLLWDFVRFKDTYKQKGFYSLDQIQDNIKSLENSVNKIKGVKLEGVAV